MRTPVHRDAPARTDEHAIRGAQFVHVQDRAAVFIAAIECDCAAAAALAARRACSSHHRAGDSGTPVIQALRRFHNVWRGSAT